MRQSVAHIYITEKFKRRGYELVEGNSGSYKIRRAGRKALCGSIALPSDLEDLSEQVAVKMLDAAIIDAVNAAVKDPAWQAV